MNRLVRGRGEGEAALRICNHELSLYRSNSFYLCWENLQVENLIYSNLRLVCLENPMDGGAW